MYLQEVPTYIINKAPIDCDEYSKRKIKFIDFIPTDFFDFIS